LNGYNYVSLIGHLGRDPETKHTPSGNAIATFSLATTSSRKAGDTWEQETEWHNIKAIGRQGETIGERVHKGDLVHVTGTLKTDSWDDKATGRKVYRTYILLNTCLNLSARKAASAQEATELPLPVPEALPPLSDAALDDIGF